MSVDKTTNSYDAVPYPGGSYPQSAPNQLATMAQLLGLKPAPVTACKVLELGCALGANLIPIAEAMPGSSFVGIDLSARQIQEGQTAALELGLHNITFVQQDLLEVGPDFGQFDYIIAHGVYSWVPAAVQEHILRICQQNLTPNGVAYVSYNTNPGWRVNGIVRDILLWGTRDCSTPAEQLHKARQLLNLMAGNQLEQGVIGQAITGTARFYVESLGDTRADDAYLMHEFLEEVNTAVYFYEFAERIAAHGLQYLTESHMSEVKLSRMEGQVAQSMQMLAEDLIDREQYKDFMIGRSFRRTLLCHQNLPVDRTLNPEYVTTMYVASAAEPVENEPDLSPGVVMHFRADNGAVLTTEHPIVKMTMLLLRQVWPQPVPFEGLLKAAYQQLGREPTATEQAEDRRGLAATLLPAFLYSPHLVSLHTHAPVLATKVSERPIARPVARWQARHGSDVTSLYHNTIKLDPISLHLLPLLDGQHDWASLRSSLVQAAQTHDMRLQQDELGIDLGDDAVLHRTLEQVLVFLKDSALLVA